MYRIIYAASLLACTASISHAAVVQSTSGIYEGEVTANSANVGLTGVSVNFEWDASEAPIGAFLAFETDGLFDLSLTGYDDNGGGVSDPRISGYILEKTDGLDGTVLSGGTLTTDFETCGQNAFTSFNYESCNYVSSDGYSGTGFELAAGPGDLLFGGLYEGFYRLKFVESGSPAAGSASFQVSDAAVVPLPASGLLLLGALGALSLRVRKKSR